MGHLLHLADVPETTISAGRWQPLNERLGITNFGISAVVIEPGEDPDIEHDEGDSGHQETYVVVSGRAAFRLGDQHGQAGLATSSRCPTRTRRVGTTRSSRARGSSAWACAPARSTHTGAGLPRRRASTSVAGQAGTDPRLLPLLTAGCRRGCCRCQRGATCRGSTV